ncbi:Respiratory nitrate reductase alpha chain (EC [uncultured Gammaproteobacteria bacterium]|nr:Respiratory nitrate reductase alpha chain (EC [uncultured Gammaproteobacteria bacterium]
MKYPLIRSRLLRIWRESKQKNADPVDAWKSIVNDKEKSREYKKVRGLGGMVRADWERLMKLLPLLIFILQKLMGQIGWSVSHPFLLCQWCLTPLALVIYRL